MTLERNIERIADALEVLAGMAAGAGAGKQNPVAAQESAGGAQQPEQSRRQSGQVPLQNGQQPGQVPLQNGQQPPAAQGGTPWAWSGSAPVQPGGAFTPPAAQGGMPGSGQVPTTAAARQYTFDQLAVATANLAAAGKDVFTILGRFGAGMLVDLPQEKYGEYAAALREAGAVV